MIFTAAATNLVPAKAGLGEADLQPRYLNMRDYTFLQKSAKSSGVDVRLWESGSGSQLALYPNLNANDEEWRKLMRDVRFRRALSLAIDREELNQVVYIGLAKPSNNTIMERSELFKPEYASKWAQYDPEARQQASRRGRPHQARRPRASACCPTGGRRPSWSSMPSEETEDTDALHLIAEYWKKIGIKMLIKPQTRENFRLRAFSGEAIMTAYAGVVTAVPTPNTSPKEFAPTMQGGLQWSRWGMFVESKGKQGEKCDMRIGLQAPRLRQGVGDARPTEAERRKAWEKILHDQRRRGLHHRHGERHPPADRGRAEDQQRAQGRLLRLGSGRIYRALPARHVLGRAVKRRRAAAPFSFSSPACGGGYGGGRPPRWMWANFRS